MIKILRKFLLISCCILSLLAPAQNHLTEGKLNNATAAQETVPKSEQLSHVKPLAIDEQHTSNTSPEVGKHVMANMDAGSMILSLLMVLALIIICAFVLKRFNLTQQSVSQLRVVTSLSLGAKERVMVVQMGEQQLLLGVTAQQITLLDKLAEPLTEPTTNTADLPKNLLSFLSNQKS
ncbi:MAG: flagellar biosynthetic protein FliO [Colwellia sp.]|nr:flagellar biosynthetic protein FliO [Colwellia sp.]